MTDPDESHVVTARATASSATGPVAPMPEADAGLIVEREALNQLLLSAAELGELAESGRLRVEGDGAKLGELLGLLDEPDPGFAIVTPESNAQSSNISSST